MIHVKVTDTQRRELEQVSRQAVGRVALRAHMVLLSARGYGMPQIAAIHDSCHSFAWVLSFRADSRSSADRYMLTHCWQHAAPHQRYNRSHRARTRAPL